MFEDCFATARNDAKRPLSFNCQFTILNSLRQVNCTLKLKAFFYVNVVFLKIVCIFEAKFRFKVSGLKFIVLLILFVIRNS